MRLNEVAVVGAVLADTSARARVQIPPLPSPAWVVTAALAVLLGARAIAQQYRLPAARRARMVLEAAAAAAETTPYVATGAMAPPASIWIRRMGLAVAAALLA